MNPLVQCQVRDVWVFSYNIVLNIDLVTRKHI